MFRLMLEHLCAQPPHLVLRRESPLVHPGRVDTLEPRNQRPVVAVLALEVLALYGRRHRQAALVEHHFVGPFPWRPLGVQVHLGSRAHVEHEHARTGTPIWMAEMPMPPSAFTVSIMSATSLSRASPGPVGSDRRESIGSGHFSTGRIIPA